MNKFLEKTEKYFVLGSSMCMQMNIDYGWLHWFLRITIITGMLVLATTDIAGSVFLGFSISHTGPFVWSYLFDHEYFDLVRHRVEDGRVNDGTIPGWMQKAIAMVLVVYDVYADYLSRIRGMACILMSFFISLSSTSFASVVTSPTYSLFWIASWATFFVLLSATIPLVSYGLVKRVFIRECYYKRLRECG